MFFNKKIKKNIYFMQRKKSKKNLIFDLELIKYKIKNKNKILNYGM